MRDSDDTARVLIVDDDAFNRDLLGQELQDLGHAGRFAADGEEALARLRDEEIDVVLLDVMMPRLDGFGVLAALGKDAALADIPVIVISALHDLDSVVRGIELGAVDYLPKPFEPVLLKARLDASLERRRARLRERHYLAEIGRERQRSNELLRALLPPEAVRELMRHGRLAPRHHDGVAVMFLDVVDFTEQTRASPPEQIVARLTALTEEAEAVAERHGLEKIKLAGDAVMITGNLLRAHETPVTALVGAALELFEAAADRAGGWQLHGGIALGPVTSGIIGRERYAFDIWGHTVNTAARLASLRGSGAVHLDQAAAEALPARFAASPLGDNALKGLGLVSVYRLTTKIS